MKLLGSCPAEQRAVILGAALRMSFTLLRIHRDALELQRCQSGVDERILRRHCGEPLGCSPQPDPAPDSPRDAAAEVRIGRPDSPYGTTRAHQTAVRAGEGDVGVLRIKGGIAC